MTNTNIQQEEIQQFKKWREDMFPEEELDSRLQASIYTTEPIGEVVKHPLVIHVGYHPFFNHQLNEQLKYKLEAVPKALAEKDWHSLIFLHERPYRIWALFMYEDKIDNDEDYWEILSAIWGDSENLWQYKKDLPKLFFPRNRDMALRYKFMSTEDYNYLQTLPNQVDIYRGYNHYNSKGWSWTLSPTRATWFAKRLIGMEGDHSARVATATVAKKDIIAYYNGRNEQEIIVNPKIFKSLGIKTKKVATNITT